MFVLIAGKSLIEIAMEIFMEPIRFVIMTPTKENGVRNRRIVMQKCLIVLTLLVGLLSIEAYAKNIGSIDEILKPISINVSKNVIYISDQYNVFYYSKDKLELLNRVGGKGEGPGQFMFHPLIKILQNKILAYAHYRIVFFSIEGNLLSQIKYDGLLWNLDMVKGNYVLSKTKFVKEGQILEYVITDSNFKEIKIIHSLLRPSASRLNKKKYSLLEPLNKFQCYSGEIFVAHSKQEGFSINVYDHQGVLLRSIKRDYEKIKITQAEKKARLDEYKSIPGVKKRWKSLSRNLEFTFPEYFPAMQDFLVKDSMIYVRTYRTGSKGVEFIILNLNGKLLNRVFLPEVKEKHFDICKNKFYYLKENDDEVWELHIEPIIK